jgi:glucosamine--fructose-6-phosphate aminotransferase (isomerizing)
MHSMMAEELAQIPEFIRSKSHLVEKKIESLALHAKSLRHIALVGRGSSAHACRFASYLLCQMTGRPPVEFHPSCSSLSQVQCDLSDHLVWAFSASGESRETVRGAQWLKQRGATVLAITEGGVTATLAEQADAIIPLLCGAERAVPATKSFIAQLLIAARLSGYELTAGASELADALGRVLASQAADSIASFLHGSRLNLLLGYGPAMAAALDGALKLQECASLPAQAWSYEAFLHGPVGFLSDKDRVVLVSHPCGRLPSGLLKALKSRVHSLCVLELTDCPLPEAELVQFADLIRIKIPGPTGFWQNALLYSVVLHQAALKLALLDGRNPDQPQGLKKITLV